MLDETEIDLLLTDVLEYSGYDFTHYARASLKRRIARLWALDHVGSLAEWRYRVRTDAVYQKRFVEELTVNVTEMFRDPAFYKTIRTEVLPSLAMKPFVRIWHAGCSTGEEVFSMAILLHEAGLLSKSLLYATDVNARVLETARQGIFPLAPMKQYSASYLLTDGKADFSSYYTAQYSHVKFHDSLRERMVFSTHNLVSDRSFNEFDLILCRNVLIYFDKALQDRVLALFDESLSTLGYLALGTKETLRFSGIAPRYKPVSQEKIWRKAT